MSGKSGHLSGKNDGLSSLEEKIMWPLNLPLHVHKSPTKIYLSKPFLHFFASKEDEAEKASITVYF